MIGIKFLGLVVVSLAITLKSEASINKIDFRKVETNGYRVESRLNKYIPPSSKRLYKKPLVFKSFAFITDITLGTPPKKFIISIDTEKSASWIFSTKCKAPCRLPRMFDSSASSTFRSTFRNASVLYRDTSFHPGILVSDVLTFGNFVIKGQEFILTDLNDDAERPYDGLLGVAYTADKTKKEPLNLLENLSRSRLVSNVFSFRLTKNEGTFILGGPDPTLYKKPFQYTSLVENGNWRFKARRLSIVDSKSTLNLYPEGIEFTIDSVFTFIGVPYDYLPLIVENFNGKYDKENDVYKVDCGLRKSSTNIEFQIEERTFRVPPSLYIYKNETSKACFLNMTPIPQDYWVWGQLLLQSIYVLFDAEQNRIGFTEYSFKSN